MIKERSVIIGEDGISHIIRHAKLKCEKCSTEFNTTLPHPKDWQLPVCLRYNCGGKLLLKES